MDCLHCSICRYRTDPVGCKAAHPVFCRNVRDRYERENDKTPQPLGEGF